MDNIKRENLDVFLRKCKEELEKDSEKGYIEIKMSYLIEKFSYGDNPDEMIARLVEKLLELELYITDGHYRLTENPARYSRTIKDLDIDESIRIYSY